MLLTSRDLRWRQQQQQQVQLQMVLPQQCLVQKQQGLQQMKQVLQTCNARSYVLPVTAGCQTAQRQMS